jgi:hypothetical protein
MVEKYIYILPNLITFLSSVYTFLAFLNTVFQLRTWQDYDTAFLILCMLSGSLHHAIEDYMKTTAEKIQRLEMEVRNANRSVRE